MVNVCTSLAHGFPSPDHPVCGCLVLCGGGIFNLAAQPIPIHNYWPSCQRHLDINAKEVLALSNVLLSFTESILNSWGEQQRSEGKRCQLNTEDVKRQQQNTTITLKTKPTKRGNTDCRCFSKMPSTEFATKPTRNHREASLQSKLSVLQCNDGPRQQELHHLKR